MNYLRAQVNFRQLRAETAGNRYLRKFLPESAGICTCGSVYLRPSQVILHAPVLQCGMHQHFIPICKENDDWSPSGCGTNHKKVDREWSNWKERTNITGDDFCKYRQKELIVHEAHGCLQGEDPSRIILQHLKIVKDHLDWSNATSNCDEIGGKLFSNLDGTLDQIEMLLDLQGNESFWLGPLMLYGQYLKLGGGVLSSYEIEWQSGAPDLLGPIYIYMDKYSRRAGQLNHSVELSSFCNML